MERLSSADLSLLWLEERGWPQDIELLAFIDGPGVVTPDGELDIGGVRRLIERRLDAAPRFRQRLVRPGGRSRPYWADDDAFDIARHVHGRRLPAGTGEAELLEACEEIRRSGFDIEHPMWQWWLLQDPDADSVAMLITAHHTMFDGLAGLAVLTSLLRAEPEEAYEPALDEAAVWTPSLPPPPRELAREERQRRRAAVRSALGRLGHPVRAGRRLVEAARALRSMAGSTPTSRTSLTRPISVQRCYALIRADLGEVKEAAHSCGGTVHDLVLALVAGGDRAVLAHRGELDHDLCLRAVAPIGDGDGDTSGGTDARSLLSTLPVTEPDPRRRLRLVVADTRARKRELVSYSQAGMLSGGPIGRLVVRAAAHQRVATHYVGNVPGPTEPLFLGTSRVREMFGLVPLMGNMTIGIGVLSYAGRLALTVVADRPSCPDLDVFVGGMRDTLEQRLAADDGSGEGEDR